MKQILSEDKLRPLEINFHKLKNNRLQESFLAMFGETLKTILRRMFGKIPSPEEYKDYISENEENTLTPEDKQRPNQQKEPTEKFELVVSGTDDDIASFVGALKAEHRYMDAYLKQGMDDENTREAKYLLNDAVEGFEKTTGLLWPFV
jgi:hypothetical protein